MANSGVNGGNGASGASRPPARHEFPCSKCLQVIVTEKLIERLIEKEAADETDAHTLCFDIARELMIYLGLSVSAHAIKLKIMEMRKIYVSFRRFTKKPRVHHLRDHNTVEVDSSYVMNHIGRETLEEAKFRDEGLPAYDDLHEIFRKKKFPMFGTEPSTSYVDPLIFSDSDEE